MEDLWWIYSGFLVVGKSFSTRFEKFETGKEWEKHWRRFAKSPAQSQYFQEKNRLEGFEGGNFPGIVDLKCSPAGEKGPHVAA